MIDNKQYYIDKIIDDYKCWCDSTDTDELTIKQYGDRYLLVDVVKEINYVKCRDNILSINIIAELFENKFEMAKFCFAELDGIDYYDTDLRGYEHDEQFDYERDEIIYEFWGSSDEYVKYIEELKNKGE